MAARNITPMLKPFDSVHRFSSPSASLPERSGCLTLRQDGGKAYSREYSMVARGGVKNDDILSIAAAGAKAPTIRQGFAELSAATRGFTTGFQNSAGSAIHSARGRR